MLSEIIDFFIPIVILWAGAGIAAKIGGHFWLFRPMSRWFLRTFYEKPARALLRKISGPGGSFWRRHGKRIKKYALIAFLVAFVILMFADKLIQ